MRLIAAIQALSLARNMEAIIDIVRKAARDVCQSDGASFILRDGERCHYVDEDAISPLWKGQKFPLSTCVSGWAMLNRKPAVIEDIYQDERVPQDAYQPTFVKSLVIVPIRTEMPIGAIGIYWAKHHAASEKEVELLQALANTTSVAVENVRLYEELEQRVEDRTRQLAQVNRELEGFSYSVSHDLQSPLRHINGYASMLLADHAAALDEKGRAYLSRIEASTMRMGKLVADLLRLAKFSKIELKMECVDLSKMARDLGERLREESPGRLVELIVQEGVVVDGDVALLRVVLENLLGNAWKFTSKREKARIEFGSAEKDGTTAYFVRDNGAGFDMKFAQKLFTPFQRLHDEHDFTGSGIGLATVARVVSRHGGRVWCVAEPGQGAAIYFTLPGPLPNPRA
jgi:signal transduction histidine kinase